MAKFGSFLNFRQKSETMIFSTPETRLRTKNLANSNEMIAINMQRNLHFWVFWAKKANFGQFLAKMSKMEFFQKSSWNICPRFWVLTNCTDPEKVMNSFFLRCFRTYKRIRTKFKFLPISCKELIKQVRGARSLDWHYLFKTITV